MALIDPSTWSALSTNTVSGTDAAAVAGFCTAVDAALKRMLRPFLPEPLTVTNAVLDAPVSPRLALPFYPVRSVTSLYLSENANGVVANFTAADLLTAGTDYVLEIDDPIDGLSRGGFVRRLNANWSGTWGGRWVRPATLLGHRLDPTRGAVLVTFLAGPVSVPADIQAAAAMAVSQMYDRRQRGAPQTSEAWNGYNLALSGQFTADAAIRSPEVMALLRPYMPILVGGR